MSKAFLRRVRDAIHPMEAELRRELTRLYRIERAARAIVNPYLVPRTRRNDADRAWAELDAALRGDPVEDERS
jgi:hypothetical protein